MKFKLLILSLFTVLLGSAGAWCLLGRPTTGIDDADIFLVYARNLVDGFGFVYNQGGEAVEGFTSLLWTLICSGVFCLGRGVDAMLLGLNVILGVIALWLCLSRCKQVWIFILLLLSAPAWFAWCQLSLMESGLWCLLLTVLGLAVVERRTGVIMSMLPLLLITRPESMLWGIWIILLSVVLADQGGRIKTAMKLSAVYGFTLLVLIAFRMGYFGFPVPNTYYAKISPGLLANISAGMGYLASYWVSGFAVLLVLIIWVRTLPRTMKNWNSSFWLAVYLLPGIGIPVLVGGDHFGAFRFYQPLWPLLCLVAANEMPAVIEKIRPQIRYAFFLALIVSGWLLFPMTANLKHEFRIAAEGRENGRALSEMFMDLEHWPTVAVITAGGNKLGYPGMVYDLMGLNSTEMAHAPGARGGFKNHTGFNRDVFYAWNPDILLCGDSPGFDEMVLNGLHKESRFKVLYTKCTLHRNGAKQKAYFSHSFLMNLSGVGGAVAPTM